jgi:S1-C subfamily serine protease
VAWGPVPSYLPLGSLPPYLAVTDRKGRFHLKGLPEGSLDLEAALTDVGRGSTVVEVRAGRATRDVRIELDPNDAPKGDLRTQAGLAVTLAERSGRVVVMMVPPGGEAEIGGLEPEDVLLEVNGVRVRRIEAARRGLTGPQAEDVILRVERDGEQLVLRVRRERVRR